MQLVADDQALLFDEHGQTFVGSDNWQALETIELEHPCVLAVHARNGFGAKSFAVTSSEGHVSSTSWRCTVDMAEVDWFEFFYDASHWPYAVQVARYGY